MLPFAIALTVGFAGVGAIGQQPTAAAVVVDTTARPAATTHVRANVKVAALPSRHGHRHYHGHKKAATRKSFETWRVWCKHHQSCVRRYSWTARGNPTVRHAKWRVWCLEHSACTKSHPTVQPVYILTGPVGAEISRLPEGEWVSTFMEAASAYGVSPEVLMGIGMVESGGGVAGTAYEGCMDYSTFGSWPGQIYCAAGVLSRVGLSGYNSVNPSYSYTVMGEADGIGIVER